ncbi:MAG: Gfo/Idh/MocA family oxidoreductase [Terrimicrobiaceae bacterium]
MGIIGVGSMGSNHARLIQEGRVPGMVLVAVCDRNTEAMNSFSGISRFSEPEEMMGSGQVDAVLIATPHYDHTPLGIAALEAGLHVIVEKPISVHKADAEKLIAAYDPAGKQIFAAMFNQRTDPRYRKLKAMMETGELGQVRRIHWAITDWFRSEAYYRSGGWRATWAGEGGGVLLNQCPHQLDLWQWLFGMPSAVTAICQNGRFHEIEVEDAVTALMEYDDGTTGVFTTTTGEAPGENRLSVATDRGLLVVGPGGLHFRRTEFPVQEFIQTTPGRFEGPPVWEIEIPVSGQGEQHLGILKNFVQAIRGEATLLAPATEGIHSVELANAMILSGTKRARVDLPISSAEYAEELKKKIATSTYIKPTGTEIKEDDFSKSF